jgi:hypothetical protein
MLICDSNGKGQQRGRGSPARQGRVAATGRRVGGLPRHAVRSRAGQHPAGLPVHPPRPGRRVRPDGHRARGRGSRQRAEHGTPDGMVRRPVGREVGRDVQPAPGRAAVRRRLLDQPGMACLRSDPAAPPARTGTGPDPRAGGSRDRGLARHGRADPGEDAVDDAVRDRSPVARGARARHRGPRPAEPALQGHPQGIGGRHHRLADRDGATSASVAGRPHPRAGVPH